MKSNWASKSARSVFAAPLQNIIIFRLLLCIDSRLGRPRLDETQRVVLVHIIV